jgi:hypothetical protein
VPAPFQLTLKLFQRLDQLFQQTLNRLHASNIILDQNKFFIRLFEGYTHDPAMFLNKSHEFLEVLGRIKGRLWIAQEVTTEFASLQNQALKTDAFAQPLQAKTIK